MVTTLQGFVARDSTPTVSFEASGGNEGSAMGSLFAAAQRGDWGLRLAGEGVTTGGYVLVPACRGLPARARGRARKAPLTDVRGRIEDGLEERCLLPARNRVNASCSIARHGS